MRALETLFAVLRHAATGKRTRDRAEASLAELRARLPAAAVTRAQAAAAALEELADALLHASAKAAEDRASGLGRARPDANPDGLTSREIEVLRLVAAGMSNQEIASELGLSIRTVERHISTIYDKVGAVGKAARALVTAYAFRHGLT